MEAKNVQHHQVCGVLNGVVHVKNTGLFLVGTSESHARKNQKTNVSFKIDAILNGIQPTAGKEDESKARQKKKSQRIATKIPKTNMTHNKCADY